MDELKQILNQKQKELNDVKMRASFKQSLSQPGLNVIAEVKRRSPSRARIAEIADLSVLLQSYEQGGAAAISVLTDQTFFGGSMRDLVNATQATRLPILRKDFIIDRSQLIEALKAGASAVLLIAAVLGPRLKEFIELAQLLSLDALVEVHNQKEGEWAIEAGAEIIGVNCRNLKTFELIPDRHAEMIEFLPSTVLKVAESGIKTAAQAREREDMGYQAILVGEALVKDANPSILIQNMRGRG